MTFVASVHCLGKHTRVGRAVPIDRCSPIDKLRLTTTTQPSCERGHSL